MKENNMLESSVFSNKKSPDELSYSDSFISKCTKTNNVVDYRGRVKLLPPYRVDEFETRQGQLIKSQKIVYSLRDINDCKVIDTLNRRKFYYNSKKLDKILKIEESMLLCKNFLSIPIIQKCFKESTHMNYLKQVHKTIYEVLKYANPRYPVLNSISEFSERTLIISILAFLYHTEYRPISAVYLWKCTHPIVEKNGYYIHNFEDSDFPETHFYKEVYCYLSELYSYYNIDVEELPYLESMKNNAREEGLLEYIGHYRGLKHFLLYNRIDYFCEEILKEIEDLSYIDKLRPGEEDRVLEILSILSDSSYYLNEIRMMKNLLRWSGIPVDINY